MNLLTVISLVTMAMAAETAPVAPDFSGDIHIDYRPIMCVKAPCPPGVYYILDGETVLARVKTISILRDGEWLQISGQYPEDEFVKGDLWIGGEDKTDGDGIGLPDGLVQIRVTE